VVRIAILDPDAATTRATILGAPVAAWQVRMAATLGCERVFVLGAEIAPELSAMQAQADRLGLKLRTIPDGRAVSAAVTVADSLILLHPDLFVEDAASLVPLTERTMVAVLPAETTGMEGMERLSAAHRWAGLASVPGRQGQALADLPPDVDVTSALLRAGIAAGSRAGAEILRPRKSLPVELCLLTADADALAVEHAIQTRRLGPKPVAPGAIVARAMGQSLVRRRGDPAGTALWLMAAMVLFLAAAAGLATLVHPGAGALALAPAWLFGGAARSAARLGNGRVMPGWLVDDAVPVGLTGCGFLAIGAVLQPIPAAFIAFAGPGWVALAGHHPSRLATMWRDGLLSALIIGAAMLAGYATLAFAVWGLAAMLFVFATLGRSLD